jgi:hypothetical protein
VKAQATASTRLLATALVSLEPGPASASIASASALIPFVAPALVSPEPGQAWQPVSAELLSTSFSAKAPATASTRLLVTLLVSLGSGLASASIASAWALIPLVALASVSPEPASPLFLARALVSGTAALGAFFEQE